MTPATIAGAGGRRGTGGHRGIGGPRRSIAAALFLLAVGGIALFATALAGQSQGVEEAIAAGEFELAYRAALPGGDAESQMLAARAATFFALYVTDEAATRVSWLELAAAAAERASTLDPSLAAGHFELAKAEGLLATTRGVLANLNTAPKLKALFDTTLELEPDHPDALVALAQWHLELSERGVAWLYGANREQVMPLFARALELAPERINLRVEYATALWRLGQVEEARRELEVALSLAPATAVDRFERDRARLLLREWGAP